jgi:hypothetical protein
VTARATASAAVALGLLLSMSAIGAQTVRHASEQQIHGG